MEVWIAAAVFLGTYALIASDRVHKTIAAVGANIEALAFNKAVANLYELANAIEKAARRLGPNVQIRELHDAHPGEPGWEVRERRGKPAHVQPSRPDPAGDHAYRVEPGGGRDHPSTSRDRRTKRCPEHDADQSRKSREQNEKLCVPERTVDEEPNERPGVLPPPLPPSATRSSAA